MAGLNVAEWSPEQVSDWLSGLGPAVQPYVAGLRARGLGGRKLLMLRCDDLEYLGVNIIGHQELILEAVEHLRNFQYELSRECIQQLAVNVSVCATSLARQLRAAPDAGRLHTNTLADVARTVHAVKPLVCWLDRWPAGGAGAAGGVSAALAARRARLLQLALEAATCAQRDRFAEQPARAVAAAALAAAAQADYIIQEVSDPLVVTPAVLDGCVVRLRGRALGFTVERAPGGHHQLADIRFGSPAHASGNCHPGDEIVQVCGQCVVGWSAEAVLAACEGSGAAGGELALRLRRRAARPPPRAPHAPSRTLYLPSRIHRYRTRFDESCGAVRSILSEETRPPVEDPESASSSDSEPLSPPASPTLAQLDHTRIYPPKPRALVQRRYTISCGSPITKRPSHTIEQFWQQLQEQRRGPAGSVDHDDPALYARDKAVSYSTGLETARPRTCLGLAQAVSPPTPPAVPPTPAASSEEERRGKLDKSHSTPAYDFAAVEPATHPPIPESPPALSDVTATDAPTLVVHSAEKADQILQFKKSSSQIGEAMQQRRNTDPIEAVEGTGPRDESTTEKILETINIAMMEHRRRSVLQDDRPPSSRCRSARRSVAPSSPVGVGGVVGGGGVMGGGGVVSSGGVVSVGSSVGGIGRTGVEALGVLRAVPRTTPSRDPTSPLKPHRPIDAAQISVPLRHITKHDIRMIPAEPREPPAPAPAAPVTPLAPVAPAAPASGDIVVGAQADKGALSPTSAVRGIFPTSKSRSLKKKSSILAKRRSIPYVMLAARGAAGGVWQRVRARQAAAPRWTRRHLLLAHNLLYAYRSPECSKADCMIYLEGFTASAAGEVKSRAHAFKVYHTGTAFYFACDSRDAMMAWIQLIHRATLLPSLRSHVDTSTHFSETDYSEPESDTDSPEKRSERDKDRDRDNKDKEKSKFGSLKKLTGRMQRSESQEHVGHTSLDRKYLRFFSRNKSKDDSKPKNKSLVPVPTEQYRSYRRAPPSPPSAPSPPFAPPAAPSDSRPARRLPKPINYIHASNPNLLDFEKSDFVTKPALQPPKPKVSKVSEHSVGLVTLEQFMLQKQAEERRQLAAYSDRVLLGVQALDTIVADVIYGEVGAPHSSGKPISVKGKDGYEKIVYPDDSPESSRLGYESLPDSPPPTAPRPPAPAPPALQAERWRDSLRRNDKVHSRTDSSPASKSTSQISQNSASSNDNWNNNGCESGSGPGVSRLRLMFGGGRTHHTQSSPVSPLSGGGGGGGGRQYPHLVCPPVFHPESYSLSRARRPRPDL